MPALVIVLVAGPALAQGFPIRDRDGGRGVAPHGYNRSGSYFVPNSDRSRPALPKRDGEVCPHGYNPSGSACVSTK